MGSTALIILGIWAGVLGYGVLYTGVQKVGGNSSYSIGQAFRGEAPATASTAQPATGGAPDPIGPNKQRMYWQGQAYQQYSALDTVGLS